MGKPCSNPGFNYFLNYLYKLEQLQTEETEGDSPWNIQEALGNGARVPVLESKDFELLFCTRQKRALFLYEFLSFLLEKLLICSSGIAIFFLILKAFSGQENHFNAS